MYRDENKNESSVEKPSACDEKKKEPLRRIICMNLSILFPFPAES